MSKDTYYARHNLSRPLASALKDYGYSGFVLSPAIASDIANGTECLKLTNTPPDSLQLWVTYSFSLRPLTKDEGYLVRECDAPRPMQSGAEINDLLFTNNFWPR